ncbi:MAG TPA: phospholipase [Pusillimonas sp.]|jgi:outer membrane phospholipase A|nr:phospholipase [Pusillimonas sp.]|tara:strand:+ start:16536 stop:17780 length:1245 start_codon:yes stop_codon:yes gene_type:complete
MKLKYSRQLAGTVLFLIMAFAMASHSLAQTPSTNRVVYAIAQQSAQPGQTITLEETQLNASDQPLQWQPEHAIRVVWQSHNSNEAAHAVLAQPEQTYILQPGTFKTVKRTLHLPTRLSANIATLNIDGYSGLLAVNVKNGHMNPGSGQLPPTPVLPSDTATTNGSRGLQPAPNSAFDAFRNAISSYEPVYFDFGSRDGANARFQISFKYRLLNPEPNVPNQWYNHLYLGYTQTSLWDLAGTSKPFVDTTYNPSVFWHNPLLWESGSSQWAAGLASGLSHRSNGKSGADSRSLNEAFIQPELNFRFDGGSQLSFQPRFKTYFSKDENPDYADYLGYVDWKLRWAQPNGWVITGLYQQGKQGRATTQLELAWPLKRTFLNMNGYLHVQYFRGYGQTLLNYQQKSEPQIRFGLALVP